MNGTNYKQTVIWDASIIDVSFLGSEQSVPLALRGLANEATKITTGAPAATAGQWAPGAIVHNAVDADMYIMTGSTASPVWSIVDNAGQSGVQSVTGFYVNNADPLRPVITVPKNNLVAVTNPGATNDNTQGYAIGSQWFNTLTNVMYVAQSVVTNSAVWQQVGTVTTKVTLSSAQILALNGTPIQLLAAPGTGLAYQVVGVSGRMNFLTAAYATHTEIDIIDTSTGNVLASDASALLAAAAATVATVPLNANSGVGVVMTANGAISAKAATGNPTAGAGTLDLYITYKVVTL